MYTDILKKYMNVFIIILYVYILYSYDFKDNIQLLLVITGIFIFIIYNNKNTKEIIEGQEDMKVKNMHISPQLPCVIMVHLILVFFVRHCQLVMWGQLYF